MNPTLLIPAYLVVSLIVSVVWCVICKGRD